MMKLFAIGVLRFLRAERGAVPIMSAFMIPVVGGTLCLAAEFGIGLSSKVENQRIADIAALAAANAYASGGSTATMTSVAQNVATLNGAPAASASASVVTSPRTPGSQAVQVTISTQNPLYLAPLVGFGRSLTVASTAVAEVGGTPSCLLALSGTSTGVTLSGGTRITATSCAVASNASVSVPCGTSITAKGVNYNGAAPTQGCSGITGPIRKAATADPLAGSAAVASASARATAAGSLATPTIPSVAAGSDLAFDYRNSAAAPLTSAGCTSSYASGTWTVTCPAGRTYAFGAVTLSGGITVNFNVSGSATNVYTFSGSIDNQGTALSFGPGTYTIAGGIRSGGGSSTSFGAGVFNIGRFNGAKCTNNAYYSICNQGTTMTFGGPSSFVITSGISNGGGLTLTLGSGSTNSFDIGPASDGNAINMGGGSTTTLADATLFEVYGNITESGGACTTLSAATNHDIRGNINLAGGLTLGSGLYAVSGYVAIGAGGGGDVTCGGVSVGVRGAGVTIVTAATSTILGSGSCNGTAICMGAGFSNVVLSAPTSGTYKDLVLIGPTATSNTAGFSLAEGAATTLAGTVYIPNGSLTLSGGASVGNVAGQCLQMIARDITLSGGTSITSNACISSATASVVKLVK